jgi:hypothetical protein
MRFLGLVSLDRFSIRPPLPPAKPNFGTCDPDWDMSCPPIQLTANVMPRRARRLGSNYRR